MLRMLTFQNLKKHYHFLYVTFYDILKMLSTQKIFSKNDVTVYVSLLL